MFIKTFKIETRTENIVTKTYYVDAESETHAIKLWESKDPSVDLQDTNEDDGVEYQDSIEETDKDGNPL